MQLRTAVFSELVDEFIEIFRGTVASFRKPVMLSFMGKHSASPLHVSRQAFALGPIPIPQMNIDTSMEQVVQEVAGLRLLKRATRPIGSENENSMGKRKTKGYF